MLTENEVQQARELLARTNGFEVDGRPITNREMMLLRELLEHQREQCETDTESVARAQRIWQDASSPGQGS